MVFTILLVFIAGFLSGRLSVKRYRVRRMAVLERKKQIISTQIENMGFRHKNKRPRLQDWQKWLLALLHWLSPSSTRYNLFRPETLIKWQRKYVKSYWWMISKAEKKSFPGRPKIPKVVKQLVIDIKLENPSYGNGKIASIIVKQLGIPISETSVKGILDRYFEKNPTSPKGQKWKTFYESHREILACMDFTVVFDWRVRPLFILNVLTHDRRQLVLCRSTYNPTAFWVAQQMREAFPFEEAPGLMLMDNDQIFLPIIKHTLPAMGVGVVKTAIKCPWQNGHVERFNRTVKDELIKHVIPIDDQHLNRLLKEFQVFYNTARPHEANDGEAPLQRKACNDMQYAQNPLKVVSVEWLGGLHHSYRVAA